MSIKKKIIPDFVQGDAFTIRIQHNPPIDMTGGYFIVTFSLSEYGRDYEFIRQHNIGEGEDISNLGIAYLKFSSDQTATIASGSYFLSIKRVIGTSSVTLVRSDLRGYDKVIVKKSLNTVVEGMPQEVIDPFTSHMGNQDIHRTELALDTTIANKIDSTVTIDFFNNNSLIGTTTDTLASGADTRFDLAEEAHGWGDHSVEGYLKNLAWDEIINPPFIPSNLSHLTNDEGFITTAQADINYSFKDHTHATFEPIDTTLVRYTDVTINFEGIVTLQGNTPVVTNDIGTSVQPYSEHTALVNSVNSWPEEQTFKGIKETVYSIPISGSIVYIDPNNGSIQTITLSNDITFDLSAFESGESITLVLVKNQYYVSWPISMLWITTEGNREPTLDANTNVLVIWKVNSTLFGKFAGFAL